MLTANKFGLPKRNLTILNRSLTQVFTNCTLFYRYLRENLSIGRIYELLSTDTLIECLREASATPSVSHYRYHQRL